MSRPSRSMTRGRGAVDSEGGGIEEDGKDEGKIFAGVGANSGSVEPTV